MNNIVSDVKNGVLTIKVFGDFDLSVYDAFHSAYPKDLSAIQAAVVDLTEVTYIDSPALGMLLLLRQQLGQEKAKITLLNPNEHVRELLDIAQFGQLMTIK
jgi:anti-anti-sigma factor